MGWGLSLVEGKGQSVRRREGSRSSGHGHDGTTRILQPLLLMILLAPFARNCHKQRLVVLQLPVATVPGHHLSYEMFPYHLSQPHLPACPVPLSMAGVFTWRTMDMKWDSSSSLNEVELKVQARIFNSASPSLFLQGFIPMHTNARESSYRTASNLHTPCSQVQFLWEG